MRALKITNSITRRDEKSLEKYLTEISRYDVLTPEEEVALFRRLRDGDQRALDKIVNHNLRFVVSVAKQYQGPGLWLGDLVNEGNIGLIKAAQKFDETKGFKFISYAVWWIRQSILQALNEKSRKIRLPLNLQGISSKVMAKRAELLQIHEREPSLAELAEATEQSIAVVKRCMDTYKMCTSLDAPLTSEGEHSLSNVLEDDKIENPDFNVAMRESQQTEVAEMLKLLPARQATVLELYFGIGHKHPMSLGDIGKHIGVSRERVRQIKDKGIHRLRAKSADVVPTFLPN